jgi:hypothetical protein
MANDKTRAQWGFSQQRTGFGMALRNGCQHAFQGILALFP